MAEHIILLVFWCALCGIYLKAGGHPLQPGVVAAPYTYPAQPPAVMGPGVYEYPPPAMQVQFAPLPGAYPIQPYPQPGE